MSGFLDQILHSETSRSQMKYRNTADIYGSRRRGRSKLITLASHVLPLELIWWNRFTSLIVSHCVQMNPISLLKLNLQLFTDLMDLEDFQSQLKF